MLLFGSASQVKGLGSSLASATKRLMAARKPTTTFGKSDGNPIRDSSVRFDPLVIGPTQENRFLIRDWLQDFIQYVVDAITALRNCALWSDAANSSRFAAVAQRRRCQRTRQASASEVTAYRQLRMWDREIGFGSSGVMTVWLKMARCGAVGALHLAIRFQPDSRHLNSSRRQGSAARSAGLQASRRARTPRSGRCIAQAWRQRAARG